MAKKIVQDVLVPDRRTIRDIPLPKNRERSKEVMGESKTAKRSSVSERRSSNSSNGTKRNYTRIGIWTVAALCVIGLLYALSFLFVSATVTVTPKKQTIPIDMVLSAKKDAPKGTLSYTLISISKDGSKEVPAAGEEKVERKASGTIVIYNNYSSAPQTLVKSTRFETSAGLIFRITDSLIVPGKITKDSVSVPGSIKATVVADKAGENYNIGLADFTIPGFKGDPKFKSFSAKSDPSSKISGGFVGTIKKVAPADALSAKTAIETSLKSDLVLLARAQIPNTHVLYYDALEYSFEQLPQEPGSTATVIVKEKGTLYGILLDKIELTKFLSEKTISYDTEKPPVFATNLEQLGVVFNNKNTFDLKGGSTVTFSFKGNLDLVWDILGTNSEGKSLNERLAGTKRSEINNILPEFSSIEKAEIVIRPFWSLSLPKSPEKITIKALEP